MALHFPELHGRERIFKHSGKEKCGRNGCLRDKSIVTTTSVCFRMKINNAYKCTLNFKALYKYNR